MQKLIRFMIVIISVALIFSSGISIAEETMKITYSRGIDDLPLYVALEEGLWEKEGIKVELVRLVGEHNIIAAALHEDIDAGHIELGGAFHTGLQNIPVKVVTWLGHAHKGTRCGLHVDTKSNINSIRDLKGKRIAESGTITTAMILSESLKSAGLVMSDINAIKGIKLDDAMKHEAALRSKGVDAIVA
jgi:ABC-type nitrate/sulfonate/bicarbonate transport system substrate-binding protein